MKNLKLKHFGTNAQGIEITGDKKNQEPEHVIIKLPNGEIEIARTSDNNYWVHVSKKRNHTTGEYSGKMSKFRLDSINDDGIYIDKVNGEHMAVLIEK